MIRTQIYLPDEMYRELKLLSAEGKERFSDLIREGAKLIIEKKTKRKSKGDPWKNFIGALKGGPRISGQELINDYYENDVV